MICLRSIIGWCLFGIVFLGLSQRAAGQEFDEQFDHWPLKVKINGKVIWGAQLPDIDTLQRVLSPAERKRSGAILLDVDPAHESVPEYSSLFDSSEQPAIVEQVQPGKFGEQLKERLSASHVFVLYLDQPLRAQEHTALIAARAAFEEHLAAGGVVIALGHAASLVGSYSMPIASDGLGLVPDSVIDTNVDQDPSRRKDLLKATSQQMPAVGIGMDKQTVLMLDGRLMRVVAGKSARILLPETEHVAEREQIIDLPSREKRPEEFLIDLTQWRREAIDRTLPPFPPAEPKTPTVAHGSLVIVGGGGMPSGLMDRFVELAGGKNQARLVYVPCTEADKVSDNQRTVEMWRKMGIEHATFIHTKDRHAANTDEGILSPLREATGIWFGGGRQWNFADSYYGTEAHRLMKQVLERGGVIGGSSAGASIQARFLARATPIGNTRIMAPGYERGGLGFISGVAIDQHFSQRQRHADMTGLMNTYPQLLGIGLDEATAIVVQGSVAEVVGAGKAHFYDRRLPVEANMPDFIALGEGSTYDLGERKVLQRAEEPAEATAETGP